MTATRIRASLLVCTCLASLCLPAASQTTGDFTADPTTGDAPLSVGFVGTLPAGVTRVLWNFGDGGTSTSPTPTHVYSQPGTYTVTMRYREGSVARTVTKADLVVVTGTPGNTALDFTATPASGEAPLQVTFGASWSQPIQRAQWSFGDGATSAVLNPTHTYTQPGTYSVSLTAGSSSGRETVVKDDLVQVADGAPDPPDPPPPPPTPGNVLLILADDIGTEMLSIYGEAGANDFPQTPVLDSLAGRGILFENAWANPLCSPTRAALLSGRYGFRTGIGQQLTLLPQTEISLPQTELLIPDLLPANYASAAIGKWHLEESLAPDPCGAVSFGFDHFEGVLFAAFDYFRWDRYVGAAGACAPTVDMRYMTTGLIDSTVDWIQGQAQPWFCYLPLQAPFNIPHVPPAELQYRSPPVTGCGIRRDCAKAATEAMDMEIGRLLDALGPDWEETVTLIFLGDNGTAENVINAPFRSDRAKGTLYERGVNVPFIVAGAAVSEANRGTRSTALVSAVDLFATSLALTGGAQPGDRSIDSVDLTPIFNGPPGTTVRDWIFAETFFNFMPGPPCSGLPTARRATTARDGRYKLILFDAQRESFFDLETDPLEETPIPTPPTDAQALSSYEVLRDLLQGPLASDC